MIDYTKFTKSLKNLELQSENYQNHLANANLNRIDQEAVAESCIQRFEVCYDCLWKVLKRYLIEGLGLPEVPNSPKPIFRLAHENKLLRSTINDWLNYADLRVDTSHDYDGDKAAACLEKLTSFIQDAKDLHQTMTGQAWT